MGRTEADPTPVYYQDEPQSQPQEYHYETETPPGTLRDIPPPPPPNETYYSEEKQHKSCEAPENEPQSQKQFQPPPQPQPNTAYATHHHVAAQPVAFPPQGPPANATRSPPVWPPPTTYPPQANAQAFPPQPAEPVAFPPQSSAGFQPRRQVHSQPPVPQMGGQAVFPTMTHSPMNQTATLPMNGTTMGTPVQQLHTMGSSAASYPTPNGDMGWKTGLFDCMEDPNNALATAFFPCLTFGQIAEIVDNGHTSCGTSGLLYGLIAGFIGLPCIMSCAYRTKLRSRYGLIESPAPDWVTHFFCEWCALCQEYRELHHRGLDPSIGWLGNVARNQNMQQQQVAMMPPMNQAMMMG